MFRSGARLIRPPVSTIVKSCGRSGGGRKVDAFYRYTVTIGWEARVSRSLAASPLMIVGIPQIESLLRATGGTGSIQWLRDGQPIEGAGDSIYIVTATDYAHLISWTDGISMSLALLVGGDQTSFCAFTIDDRGHLMLYFQEDTTPPAFTINNGHLIYSYPDGIQPLNLSINETGNLILTF